MPALHQTVDADPKILTDPIAPRLIDGDDDRGWLAPLLSHPFAKQWRAGFALRSRYAEDCLAERVRSGVRRDRIPEVALLRTLGFGPKRVGTLLFTEAALIGLFGGLLGAGLAYALFASGIDLGSITAGLGLVRVTPLVTTASFIVAILVGLVSATLPVAAALRTAPAIGLKKVV
jgi:hypothetical protein